MPTKAVNGIVQVLRSGRLLEPPQLEELNRTIQNQFADSHALVKELLRRGWLTTFQANQLLQGKGKDLLLGPYLLVERLGEGANGQVFKARHQAMNRIIALKVLRKDLLADNDAIARFYREIEVASRVSHPHIVHAFDAGPIGASHVLAMEYVEGCDLDRLVREHGPLAIAQACDYIRQAALGLQHAQEKGLVHRDIKPSNLLVARGPTSKSRVEGLRSPLTDSRSGLWTLNFGVVKLLDLGLARFQQYAKDSQTHNLTMLSGSSVMMGTPDYLAPEQALDFHTADIRADIYSLGCTLFYLLTGQAPFAGQTLAEKLMKHQTAPLPSLAAARKEAPAALLPILEKMAAKRPGDRYQTPGEVAAALTTLLSSLNGAIVPGVGLSGTDGVPARKRGSSLRIQKEVVPPSGLTPPGVPAAKARTPAAELSRKPSESPEARRRLLRLTLGSGAILATALLIFGLLLARSGPAPETGVLPSRSAESETKLVKAEARPAKPFLIFQCGLGDKGNNQVQLRRPGYDCKLLQGEYHDGWGGPALRSHCWHHAQELRFEVTVAPGTAGILRLWLVDGDNLGRKERLIVQGKTIGEYANYGPGGQEVAVPISAEAAKTGKINVTLVNLGPANAVVSTVEFDALPTGPKR